MKTLRIILYIIAALSLIFPLIYTAAARAQTGNTVTCMRQADGSVYCYDDNGSAACDNMGGGIVNCYRESEIDNDPD
jgi:hypothetical protein